MGWSGLSQGSASVIGDVLGTVMSARDQTMQAGSIKTANQLADQAQANQRADANSAHQREVADLRAAGLNPLLSASGGSGAPISGGASGFQVRQSIAPKLASSAQAAKSVMDSMLAASQGKIASAQAKVADDIANSSKIAAIANAQTAQNNARVSSVDASITDSPYGRGVEMVRRASEAGAPLVNALSGLARSSARSVSPGASAAPAISRIYIPDDSKSSKSSEGGDQ